MTSFLARNTRHIKHVRDTVGTAKMNPLYQTYDHVDPLFEEAQSLARACMPPPACMLPPALILVPAWINRRVLSLPCTVMTPLRGMTP